MLYFSPVEGPQGEKSYCPTRAGRQGIGHLANPFLNLTVFIREIRAKKN